jgi:selenium-binding protein 1
MITKFNSRRYFLVWVAVIALLILAAVPASAGGFTHGIVINVDGTDYYLGGAPDGPGGAIDVPGHYWAQAGPDQLVGKHYNTGPFGAPSWWSSDAPNGELLYIVHAVIDTWSEEKAEAYAAQGYVHYHELVTVADGTLHPDKVVWLKHIARTSFNLDGGPHPELAHEVTPGIDFEFVNNYFVPYSP